MTHTYWIERWKNQKTGWHKSNYNTRLMRFSHNLISCDNPCVFIPLCGKSLDMIYLLKQGVKVIGVELSELAVKDFFIENQLNYTHDVLGNFMCYHAKNIDIFVGDFFNLTADMLVEVNGVYDRAALIALPQAIRQRYAQHLNNILPQSIKILLLTLAYQQSQKDGPPFSVDEIEILQLFSSQFKCTLLENINDLDNEPKFKELGLHFLEKITYLLEK